MSSLCDSQTLLNKRIQLSLWQSRKHFMHQLTSRKKNIPGREENDHEIGKKGYMLLVPHFYRSLIIKNFLIRGLNILTFGHNLFLIPEDHGADTGNTRPGIIDPGLYLRGIMVKTFFH